MHLKTSASTHGKKIGEGISSDIPKARGKVYTRLSSAEQSFPLVSEAAELFLPAVEIYSVFILAWIILLKIPVIEDEEEASRLSKTRTRTISK
jgi:hypothetical protein